ncbi:MAG: hypothetical protein KF757_06105 [Phycisphaeraceae bacterium]|nr:hypothetical protein [Phycisphaeraceae bacterium]MCW5763747.1 hypothetical protein [Phycisphaeraceae bacterium]
MEIRRTQILIAVVCLVMGMVFGAVIARFAVDSPLPPNITIHGHPVELTIEPERYTTTIARTIIEQRSHLSSSFAMPIGMRPITNDITGGFVVDILCVMPIEAIEILIDRHRSSLFHPHNIKIALPSGQELPIRRHRAPVKVPLTDWTLGRADSIPPVSYSSTYQTTLLDIRTEDTRGVFIVSVNTGYQFTPLDWLPGRYRIGFATNVIGKHTVTVPEHGEYTIEFVGVFQDVIIDRPHSY